MSRSRLETGGKEFQREQTDGKTRTDSKIHVLGNMPTQRNYPQWILRTEIRTQAGERFEQNLPAGENACIGEYANTAKNEPQRTSPRMSKKDSPGEAVG